MWKIQNIRFVWNVVIDIYWNSYKDDVIIVTQSVNAIFLSAVITTHLLNMLTGPSYPMGRVRQAEGPRVLRAPKHRFWQKPHFGGILQFDMSDPDWDLTVHCRIRWYKGLWRPPLSLLPMGPISLVGPWPPSTLRWLCLLTVTRKVSKCNKQMLPILNVKISLPFSNVLS